ncbi:MAG: hypothetical protein QNJ46_26510 [Leptolyngbyaceae cyanobacterium MO_188.B28]|nr:hypothetical protein [Leptolyngbyaceae cyanobacterium MO_188.B28]
MKLPSSIDPTQAARVLGNTAKLSFRVQQLGTERELMTLWQLRSNLVSSDQPSIIANAISDTQLADTNAAIAALFEHSDLTEEHIEDALARPSAHSNRDTWEVVIEFNETGAEKFTELTKQIAGTGRALGVFLDEQLLTSPVIDVKYAETGITTESVVIFSTFFTMETAKDLEIQLKSGVLPVPVELIAIEQFGLTVE